MAEKTVTHSGADRASSRYEIMNDIEARRTEEINAELEESGSTLRLEHDPTPEIKLASGKDATDVEIDPEDADAAAAEAERVAEAARVAADKGEKKDEETIYDFLGEDKLPTTKVKIKVDGVEQEVSVNDLVRGHQKNASADKRLEEASIARKSADKLIEDARTQAEKIIADATAAGKKPNTAGDGGEEITDTPSGKDAIGKAMNLIYDGHQDEAAGILDAEINRRVQEAKAPDATVDTAELAAKIKTDLSWDAALSKFNTDHAEIASDPDLRQMFQTRLNAAGAAASTPQEAIEKALEAMPSWLSKVSDKPGDKPDKGLTVDTDALEKRKAEKAAADAVRSNSSIRSQSRTEPEQKYDPSAVVAEMREARGQK